MSYACFLNRGDVALLMAYKSFTTLTRILKRCLISGLSSTQIKTIALIAMTLDHIGTYCALFPLIDRCQGLLHTIGRAAAPLFLFCMAQSIIHTHSKGRFLARMYFAAVATGICNTVVGSCLSISFTNIYHSFVWVIVITLFFDKAVEHWHSEKRVKSLLIVMVVPSVVFATSIIQELINGSSGEYIDMFGVFFQSIEKTEYSSVFIMLGVAWYYCKRKSHACVILITLSIISFFTPTGLSQFSFICGEQWAIVLSVPIIALYNGKRGKNIKSFFYFYYPVHKYALAVVAKILD